MSLRARLCGLAVAFVTSWSLIIGVCSLAEPTRSQDARYAKRVPEHREVQRAGERRAEATTAAVSQTLARAGSSTPAD